MNAERSFQNQRSFQYQRRPPDVEEALSSMLWTPYERTATYSSSDEDEERLQAKRMRRLDNNYDHRITCEPITSIYFGDGEQTTINTTSSLENVANSLQSTPFVPFSKFLNNNSSNNNNDFNACYSRSHRDHTKIKLNRKQLNSVTINSFRFSYPYYGPIPSLKKRCSSPVSSKQPPSYESLYAKSPAAPVQPKADDSDLNVEIRSNKEPLQRETTFEIKRESSLQLLRQTGCKAGKLLLSKPEKSAENESHIVQRNYYNNVAVDVATRSQSSEATDFRKERTKCRSQQTKECNNNINNNNNYNEKDGITTKNEKQLLMRLQRNSSQPNATAQASSKKNEKQLTMRLQRNSSQPNATAQATSIQPTEVTDKSIKETERLKTTSYEGEEVSQPDSYIDNSKISLSISNLCTNIMNNHTNNTKSNHITLNTTPMNNDGYPNNETRVNTNTITTSTNLFDASWSDKATTVKRAHESHWESVYSQQRSVPTVTGAVTFIQSATCSLNGRVNAHKYRSSFVNFPSYSHLWKKTLNGVRRKVKRAKRSNSHFENIHVPIVAPLNTLTPNKCLAELECLYAEFRASESALVAARDDISGGITNSRSQHGFGSSHHNSEYIDSNSGYNCECLSANNNNNNSDTVNIDDVEINMRLNIPPTTNKSSELSTQQRHAVKALTKMSTSSVFLSSSDCLSIHCMATDDRPKGRNTNGDDRCINLLHEVKNNYDNCSNDTGSQKINYNEDVVSSVQNDAKSETIGMISSTATALNKSSLKIHVNSDNSDQNNNNNCTNNNNNSYCNYPIINNCEYNDCVGMEKALENLNIDTRSQQLNIVKSNGVCVVNCNYSSVYTINNDGNISHGECNLSPTTTTTKTIATPVCSVNVIRSVSGVTATSTTTTPVCSVSVNRSVSETSLVANILFKGKISVSSDNIVDNNDVKIGSNNNVTDQVNILRLTSQPQDNQMCSEQASNTSVCVPLARSVSKTELSWQTRDISPLPTSTTVTVAGQSRTFASTECQTDETLCGQLRRDRVPVSPVSNRAQRRRDRRGRRHLQHQLSSSYPHPLILRMSSPLRNSEPQGSVPITGLGAMHIQSNAYPTVRSSPTTIPAAMSALLRPMLPNLLHRHFPPPYRALSLNGCPSAGLPSSASPALVASTPPSGTTILRPVISTVPMPTCAPPVVSDGRFSLPLPIIRRSPSERSGKGCCGQWFAGPPLRALIAVVALGGVACALGGVALGATALGGHPNSYFTAALLMIGVGVVLVTVSGAAWRMTAPGGPLCLGWGSAVDLGRCSRRPCGRGGGTSHGLLYPEFQHRPPPPSYQASMQEYRLRLLLLDRDRQNGIVRGNSPPPTYRSYVGSLLRAPLSTAIRRGGTTSSIAGTSEHSLPPSYRSRNNTPATISSARSIEIAPSDRLLANEDVPEPSSREQLPNSNTESICRTLTEITNANTATTSPTTQKGHQQNQHSQQRKVRTSAIVEIEATSSGDNQLNHCKNKQGINKAGTVKNLSSTSHKDLVTIVTISKSNSQEDMNRVTQGEHIEILAHL